ncbi:MXAN_6640 family putative metalloprotease [Nocardioides sp.]|uniref:MXAN_6640 family putative metalloprotease n=1 Tax=Nocardioides sp. TaxID=35761 RepID=UPI0031FEFAFF|nr:hypothetical protein [Nocardioides sp.]
MRRSVATVLVALSTALTVLPATTSSATNGTGSPAARPTGRVVEQRAARALDRVTNLLAGTATAAPTGSRPDASLAMLDLFRALPDLSGADRAKAQGLLARPTDGPADQYGDGYLVPARKKCSTKFCIHWVSSTADAPPNQKWVNKSLGIMNKVWRAEVQKLGYRAPIKDGSHGGNSKFDVYLKELGGQGLYGYCAPEYTVKGEKYIASGYCVLDDDFARSQFGRAPIKSLRVTAAHEFFHAIQFAYDDTEDHWFMEATATWMEERFADEVNDNRQYLPYGQVKDPGSSLDIFNQNGFNQYGNWPFFEYLSEKYGNGVVKSIWNKAYAGKGAPDAYSIQAVKQVLDQKAGFANVFRSYAAANTNPSGAYAEGSHWPSAAISKTWSLGKSARVAKRSTHIDHLASRNFVIKPDNSLQGSRWQASVTVNAPSAGSTPAAYLIIKKSQGGSIRKGIPLSDKGYGKVTFSFSRASVKSATITLVNASTRYRCWRQNAVYSCQGKPLDEAKGFGFKATVFKP